MLSYFPDFRALGNVMCKLLKFGQSVVLIASNYMVVVLSIDRHQAIRAPLKEPIPVSHLNGTFILFCLNQFYYPESNIDARQFSLFVQHAENTSRWLEI